MITLKRTNRRYRGTAVVETAIVMVLLLMLLLGTMSFGYLFLRAEQVTNAARHGARLACVSGANLGNVATNIDAYLAAQGVSHNPTKIEYGANNTVKATVYGKDFDILHASGIVPITNDFSASVTMAKEGP
jgi:Flp pilus assembly protein TadG